MKQYQKLLILAAASVFVVACAKKGPKGGMGMGGAGAGADGAYAQGYGGTAGGMGGSGIGSIAACGKAGANVTTSYFFAFDSSELSPADMSSVQQHAGQIRGPVRLEGNTDERGSREYNNALGWRRANAVKQAMEQYGVSGHQLKVVSYGSERPLAAGNDEQAFMCNRRVDLAQ
jgi:peptidoglycan-associated lipoprotein